MNITPTKKALLVSALFACAGVVEYVFYPGNGVPALGLFFIVLTVNTYFSIRFYAKLFPHPAFVDHLIDATLVVLYLGLATTLSSILLFEYIGFLMFVVATTKYALLLRQRSYESTLRKKIRIDTYGIMLFAFCTIVSIARYEVMSSWMLALLFLGANVYLLIFKPMYRVIV